MKKKGASTPVSSSGARVANESWFHVAAPHCSKMSKRREERHCLGLLGRDVSMSVLKIKSV